MAVYFFFSARGKVVRDCGGGESRLSETSIGRLGAGVNCFIHENVSYVREQRTAIIVTNRAGRLGSALIVRACIVRRIKRAGAATSPRMIIL